MQKESGGAHYGTVDPFTLTRVMQSSGNAHVDGCRCAIIKYGFRLKGSGDNIIPKLIDDLEKAKHYAEEAITALKRQLESKGQPELPFVPFSPRCPQCDLSAADCPCDPSPFDSPQ